MARSDVKKEDFSLTNLTKAKGTPEGAPFMRIKRAVLGDSYSLSLTFIGSTRSRRLNALYRGKDKPANVLSFPLSEDSGEIFIDISRAKAECAKFGMTEKKFLIYLFIHGLLHLKGMEHGATMERKERELLENYYGAPNRSGHRYRNIPSKGRHRRGSSR